MPANLQSVKRVSSRGYEYTWTGGTPPYRLVLDGVPYRENYALTSIIVEGVDAEEPPVLEILDATETTSTTELFPPWYLLQWRGNTTAAQYRVEQYVDGVWVRRGTVRESGLGYYQYPTEAQAEVGTVQFRVIAVDSEGNDSEAAALSVFNIRHPNPPSVSMAYAGGNVTVSAR